MYLTSFTLPIDTEEDILARRAYENGGKFGYIDNPYPCSIFPQKLLGQINFENITILYGGNGSGKSTLLNLIAQKLELNRIAPFNSSETFDMYVEACKYELGYDDEGFKYRVPNGSRIITSDDIFDYMLAVRTNNSEISENKGKVKDNYHDIKYGDNIRFNGMEDFDEFSVQILSRKKSVSRRQFIKRMAGDEVKLNSNGETALKYFDSKLKNDTLYCLDEPENSLSPKLQQELVQMIEEMAHYCGCQFIIATHSPFLLAMKDTVIYDLDSTPSTVKKWWELENTKTYFDFFYKNKDLFLKDERK